MTNEPIYKIESVELIHNIKLTNPEGKSATIDFSSDAIIYGGDLPVEESAQIFFEHIRGFLVPAVLEELRKLTPGAKTVEEYVQEHYPNAIAWGFGTKRRRKRLSKIPSSLRKLLLRQ